MTADKVYTQRLPAIFVFKLRSDPNGHRFQRAWRGSVVRVFARLHLVLTTQAKADAFRLSTQDRPATTLLTS